MNDGTISNKVFIGCPSEKVKGSYERIARDLAANYPLFFFLMDQPLHRKSSDLLELIKKHIKSSSWAIFDATGNNPNVALEYGYAQGINVECTLFYNDSQWTKKRSEKRGSGILIMADIAGLSRNQYKNENALMKKMVEFSKGHPYTERFERAIASIGGRGIDGRKRRRYRNLALKAIRFLDGKEEVRRESLKSKLLTECDEKELDTILKTLRDNRLINKERGPHSRVSLL